MPGQKNELALGNMKVHAFQGGSLFGIDLTDVAEFDHGIWG